MDKVTLDPAIRSKLGKLDHQLAMCDESGQVLGYFVPLPQYGPELHRWAEAQIPPEELDRRSREPGGRTTAEVLRRLEAQ